ncbi:MAG: SDR family oxidoreductase [Candidatus Sumerlaeia bacterium]|nr:SDR family oxidoreductase [Candidatus Sumerlaeia bacterium]
MDLKLANHTAVVQGASRGLGLGIARALAEEGVDLVLTARNLPALEAAARSIEEATGRRAVPLALDSASPEAASRAVEAAQAAFGRLDILVCNSGGPPAGAVLDLTDQQWLAAAELLVLGPVRLLREALPLLRRSPAPRFFVVTSSSTRQPVPGLALSNTYRPGVHGLVKALSDELAADRVRCHSLAPGRFDTDRLAHLFKVQSEKSGKPAAEIRAAVESSIPAGRLGDPAEFGKLAAFLASPHADYLTGQNWMVDGGLTRAL